MTNKVELLQGRLELPAQLATLLLLLDENVVVKPDQMKDAGVSIEPKTAIYRLRRALYRKDIAVPIEFKRTVGYYLTDAAREKLGEILNRGLQPATDNLEG